MKDPLSSVATPTAKDIAKKNKLSLKTILKQMRAGIEVEKEHTKSSKAAKEIASDHLGERPDYYIKLKKMEKSPVSGIKEELGTGDVRGLGYVTGDPAGTLSGVDKYIGTNMMSYEDENGNKLDYIRKQHTDLHNSNLGYKAFDPTRIGAMTNFGNLKEQKLNELGDLVKTGMPGYEDTSMPRNTRKNEVKEQGPVYTRYTERPTYEAAAKDKFSSTESERGIYEKNFSNNKKEASRKMKKPVNELFDTPKGKEKGKEYVHRSMMHMYQQGRSDEDEGKRRRNLEANPAMDQSGKQGEKVRSMHDRTMKNLEKNWRRQSNRIKYVPKALDRLAKEEHVSEDFAKIKTGENEFARQKKYANQSKSRLKEDRAMDTRDYISEAIINIMEENLVNMKENFGRALQEKAMEKLEERKKEIAANYFAQ